MDIDEFLDRELSDIGLQTDKTEKTETVDIMASEADSEQYPIFEHIQSNLIKGDIDEAEKSYIRLWSTLIEQKLKWNDALYEQLSTLARQFSSVINQAHNETKKKAEHINELINRARAALKEGKKEIPFKIYSEVQEIGNSIPDAFFEEKKLVQEQILEFYNELSNTTDSELVKRVYSLIQEVNHVIDKANIALRANDTINAILHYNKSIELFKQVPEGFLRHKNSAGMRILDIYKSLSIYREISELQKQLFKQQQKPEQNVQQAAAFARNPPQNMQQINISKSMILSTKKERARKNMENGLYEEASRDIQEVLQLEPNDAEAKAIHAKIKTFQ